MGERRFQINAAQTISLGTFFARQMLVSNLLPRWLYFRIGGSDVPAAANADLSVPPLTVQLVPLPTTNIVTVGLGPVLVTLGAQVAASQNAVVTLYDTPLPVGIGSIDLNPTRMGQSVQQNFVGAGSYTLTFPATQVYVQNYTGSWVYIATGTLVVPTAATAMASVPPMTERSLPCPPTTQFAFGLSADLVTKGEQVPVGVNIIATFYEYPTPVSVGTADLNPSKMGKMAQQKFVAPSSYTIAFMATTVHVANYSPAWVYVKFDSLVIPTVATADVALPPMSEKSLTCLPATQFAFGLSADLVTQGQQVPVGVNIIATFFEYPTPVSVGTANLNPTRLGNSVSAQTTVSTVIDPAFPVAQINISNYLRNWIYVTYGQVNLLLNADLETWPGAVPTSWTWQPLGGGLLTQAAGYRGNFSAHINQVGVNNSSLTQIFAVTPGQALTYSFWYRTDGQQAYYAVYDVTNLAFIIPVTATGAAPAQFSPFRVTFIVPAGCVSVKIYFMSVAVAGSNYWVDSFTVQATTTAANAQIAVPPLSEKSITLPPSTHVDIVVGTQTVMTTTSLPITTCLLTCFEYAVPVNLGVAPLSPGGFRYTETIIAAGARTMAQMSAVSRNLSNFDRARLTLSWSVPSQPDLNLGVSIWRSTAGAITTPICVLPYSQAHNLYLEFAAGCEVMMICNAIDQTGGGLPAGTITVAFCVLEAW